MRVDNVLFLASNEMEHKNLFVYLKIRTCLMCALSMILNYGMQFPPDYWNFHKVNEFNKLVDAAKAFDVKTGQADCEIQSKVDWYLDLIDNYIDKLIEIE